MVALAKPFTRGLLTKSKNAEDSTTGVNKFISGRPNFRARKKMGAQNKTAHPIETQLDKLLFIFCYLNSTQNFHFQFVSNKSFFNEAFVV